MLNFYATGAPFEFKSKNESLKKRHVARLASPVFNLIYLNKIK